ncbi:MAG: response regulator [Leptospiraceae bacterium]|nr:response regulator [Leptospiraceae bacterium]
MNNSIKPKTILFVDDEILVLMALKSQVKKAFGDRFRYEIAADPEEAWEVINDLIEEKEDISLIISDWLMPGEKGDEFLRKVNLKFPDIHLIIISGQADEKSVEILRAELNKFNFIKKPWSEKELIDIISSITEARN